MHRTFIGNFQKTPALFGIKFTGNSDATLNPVQFAGFRFAAFAFGGVDLVVAQLNFNMLQRQALSLGIHTKSH